MPKKLWNVDHQPHVIDWSERAVMPGEPYEFSDEQIAAGLAGQWSEEDPRAGLEAEKAFKKRRDAPVQDVKDKQDTPTDTPAEPEKE